MATLTNIDQDHSRAPGSARFVVATPQRSVCDDNARVLEKAGVLRFLALGTRRGTERVPLERTRLNPAIGLLTYAASRALGTFKGESFRFRLLPWFDRWVLKQLTPGDHMMSSYGYANACFQFIRQHGGKTFVDAGNSHIENFWQILSEEHRKWKSPYLPVSRFWYERARAMLAEVDFVLSPSSYVSSSFLERGFRSEQILSNVYPVNLAQFHPPAEVPKNRPLTIINTGSLSLRKGTPYLLEAFKIVHRKHPSARLLLTRDIREDVLPILTRYQDLPIEWSPLLPHTELLQRLHSSDVFVLPSLEEGLARSALEAMASGLQVVLTPNTGANDFIKPGVNGEVVAIRDSQATAEAILKCAERLRSRTAPDLTELRQKLSFETFELTFLNQLKARNLIA